MEVTKEFHEQGIIYLATLAKDSKGKNRVSLAIQADWAMNLYLFRPKDFLEFCDYVAQAKKDYQNGKLQMGGSFQ